MAQWIRQTKNIKGININGDIHKLALYADDILIYLSTPTTSLPELMTLLEKFGSYAGYKLNIQKTQTLSFKYTPPVTIKDKLNMKWDQKSLKYLGIHLTKEISTLAKVNYDPLLINIKNDIHRWNAVSFLSFSQRIDAIRVNVLPRYLYLFQALPTEIPQTHWSELNKTISRFIWQGKKPRIKLKAVELPKEQGGMALPYFKDYFYAAQTKYLVNLCNPTYQAKWKDIEITLMNDPPLQAILAHKNLGGYIEKTQNLWIKAQLKIWNIIKEEYKLNDKLQIIQWCAYDTEFKPNQMDYRFKSWISKGILTFYSLTEKGLLKDFESLKKEYNLDKSDFYRYLQLRNHFENNIKIKTDLDDSILKIFIDAYKGSGSKGIISKLYKGFRSIKPHSTEYVKEKWEKESNSIITVEEWLDICRFTSKCTNSHMWREFGWKCLMRFFITPKQRAYTTGKNTKCWRLCGSQEPNHWHIFWECPVIKQFWVEVHGVIENILNITLPFQFIVIYFGSSDIQICKSDKYLLDILIIAAKKAITRHWLLPESPTTQEWLEIVYNIYVMEKITFSLRLQINTFRNIWSKWTDYVRLLHPIFIEI